MSILYEIPLEVNPDASYKVGMNSQVYDLRIRYNQRTTNKSTTQVDADEFTLSLALSGKEPLFTTPLKTNRDLLRIYRYIEGVPSGELQLRDTLADQNLAQNKYYSPERVSYDTLGTRFVLYYLDTEN
jgi:hypothetical protein